MVSGEGRKRRRTKNRRKRRRRRQQSMQSLEPPWPSGQTLEKSNQSDSMETGKAGDTAMQTCEPGSGSKKRKKEEEGGKSCSTPECPQPSKKKRGTYKRKSKRKSRRSSPNEPTRFSPWLKKEESRKLWSPIETDLRSSRSSSLNGRFAFTGRKSSWFHVNKFQPIETR